MGKVFICLLACFQVILPSITFGANRLYDDFSGYIVNSNRWHIPTWQYDGDGTYVGRTQFRCTQNSTLPAANGSNAIIAIETYNPTGLSFYGTDLISNASFALEAGIHITVRARMDTSTPGIVGGIFLYAIRPGSGATLHDEIDFELLTNIPNGVQTNIYCEEPLGEGHPQFVTFASGSINDIHTYEIEWQPNQVSWFIDGNLVRADTSHVPMNPMFFHLNIWVPDSDWAEAYSPDLIPAPSESSNEIFWMSVDLVNIRPVSTATGGCDLAPIVNLLLLDDSP